MERKIKIKIGGIVLVNASLVGIGIAGIISSFFLSDPITFPGLILNLTSSLVAWDSVFRLVSLWKDLKYQDEVNKELEELKKITLDIFRDRLKRLSEEEKFTIH